MEKEKIGLIAGNGGLPRIFLEKVKKKDIKIVIFLLKDISSPKIDIENYKSYTIDIEKVTDFFKFITKEGIKKVIFFGGVNEISIKDKLKKLAKLKKTLNISNDNDTNNTQPIFILKELGNIFKNFGIEVISPESYMPDLLFSSGIFTKKKPSKEEMKDVLYGYNKAKSIADSDIGQTIVVKNKTVISVEGPEGTNEAIKRASIFCKNFVVIKVARTNQDMRYDVPTVGVETIQNIIKYNGSVLALDGSKKMYFIDIKRAIKLADEHDITIISIKETKNVQ